VIDKIRGEASVEFDKMFPVKQPSKVVVKTIDGSEYSEYLEFPKGDPREPMTIEDLDSKFEGLTSGILSKDKQADIRGIVFRCEEMDTAEFMAGLKI